MLLVTELKQRMESTSVFRDDMKSIATSLLLIPVCWRKMRMLKICGAIVGSSWLLATGEITA
jgi:hypothetical protein